MSRLAWGLAAFALLLGSHGSYLNDEDDQASSFWNLSRGSLRVESYPDAFYRESVDIRAPARYAYTEFPVGSTALNILALPVAAVLMGLDLLMPLGLALGAAFVACAWKALGWRWPWQKPHWSSAVVTVGFLVVLLAAATGGFRPSSPTTAVFYPYAALKLTNLALWGGGVALLWRVLLRLVPDRTVRVVVLLTTALGPWMFWGAAMKYHALSIFLSVLALWLVQRVPTRWNVLSRGFVAGLAIWVNLAGIALAFALGVFELGRAVRGRHWGPGTKALGIALLGVLLGLAPAFAENTYLFGNPMSFGRVAVGASDGGSNATGDSPGPFQATWLLLQRFPAIVANFTGLGDPLRVLENAFVIHTTGHTVEGQPLGTLMIAPLLILAVPGLAVLLTRRLGGAPTLALLTLAAMTLFVTGPAMRQGAGWDVRMWSPALPALGVLAGVGLSALWSPGPRALHRVIAAAVVWLVLLLAALVLLVSAGFELGRSNFEHIHRFFFFAWIATALGVGMTYAIGILRGSTTRHAAVAVGMLVAMPLLWSTVFMLGNPYEIYANPPNEGGTMFVTGMNPVAAWFEGAIVHDPPLPFVYNENGDLVFHPDYGLCTRDPSPCPDAIRSQFQRPPYEDA